MARMTALIFFLSLLPHFSSIAFSNDVVISTTPDEARPGEDGRDAPQEPSSIPGRDGADGGNATPAGSALDSDDLEVTVVREGESIVLSGYRINSRGGRISIGTHRVSALSKDRFILRTESAPAPRGYHAGRPQPGSKGLPGDNGIHQGPFHNQALYPKRSSDPNVDEYRLPIRRNADQYPTRGRPGGRSGDAGQATDGGNRPRAGEQEITIREDQLENWAALSVHLEGGPGGTKGKIVSHEEMPEKALGGDGGKGITEYQVRFRLPGDGVKSLTLQRRERPSTQVQTYYLQGGRTARVHIEVPAIVPDAENGTEGALGRPSHYQTRDGSPSRNGELKIFTIDPSGNRTGGPFTSGWKPIVQSIELAGQDANGLLESEEEAYASVTVFNGGDLPMPADEILLKLSHHPDIEMIEGSFLLPSLRPRETRTFKRAFQFRPKKLPITEGIGAQDRKVRMEITATMPTFGSREVPGFSAPSVHARLGYPLMVKNFRVLEGLQPGQASYVIGEIQNRTSHDISRRGIETSVELQLQGIDSKWIVFLDENDRPIPPKTAWVKALEGVKANDTEEFRLKIGVREGAPSNTAVNLGMGLKLQLFGSDGLEPIQRTGKEVTIAEGFDADPEADVVLVVSPDESKESVDQMIRDFNLAGQKVSVFQLAVEPTFDLNREYGGTRLGEYLENKVVVVIDRPFQPEESERGVFYPRELFSAAQMRKALAENGTGLVVMSDNSRGLGVARVVDPALSELRNEYSDQETFLEERQPLDAAGTQRDRTALRTLTWFLRPGKERYEEVLSRLENRLIQASPAERHLLVTEFSGKPRVVKRSLWNWPLFFFFGKFRRTFEIAETDLVRTLDRDSLAMAEANFSQSAVFAAFLVSSFKRKMDLLSGEENLNPLSPDGEEAEPSSAQELNEWISDVVSLSLTEELIALQTVKASLSVPENLEAFEKNESLRNADKDLLIRTHARVLFLSSRLEEPLSTGAETALQRAFDNHFHHLTTAEKNEVRQAIRKEVEELARLARNKGGSPFEQAVAVLREPLERVQAVANATFDSVISPGERRSRDRDIQRLAQLRKDHVKRFNDKRGDLLVPGCEGLLGAP